VLTVAPISRLLSRRGTEASVGIHKTVTWLWRFYAVDGGRLVRGTAPDLEERRRRSSSMHDLALERSGAAHAAIASRERFGRGSGKLGSR